MKHVADWRVAKKKVLSVLKPSHFPFIGFVKAVPSSFVR